VYETTCAAETMDTGSQGDNRECCHLLAPLSCDDDPVLWREMVLDASTRSDPAMLTADLGWHKRCRTYASTALSTTSAHRRPAVRGLSDDVKLLLLFVDLGYR